MQASMCFLKPCSYSRTISPSNERARVFLEVSGEMPGTYCDNHKYLPNLLL